MKERLIKSFKENGFGTLFYASMVLMVFFFGVFIGIEQVTDEGKAQLIAKTRPWLLGSTISFVVLLLIGIIGNSIQKNKERKQHK